MEFPSHPFWDFSLKVHEQDGVHDAYLQLQVNHALDVNLLFFCCWAGSVAEEPLGETAIKRAMHAVAGWQEHIVRPVWRARHRLKPRFSDFPVAVTEPLRRVLVSAEVDAEHIEQLHLARILPVEKKDPVPVQLQLKHAVCNLADYLCLFFKASKSFSSSPHEHKIIPDDVSESLSKLLSACFHDATVDDVMGLLDKHLTCQSSE